MVRDVTVHRIDGDDLVVTGREPAVVGEPMTLEIFEGGTTVNAQVLVVESLPVIVDGAVRHRLRLRRVAVPERVDVTSVTQDQELRSV